MVVFVCTFIMLHIIQTETGDLQDKANNNILFWWKFIFYQLAIILEQD